MMMIECGMESAPCRTIPARKKQATKQVLMVKQQVVDRIITIPGVTCGPGHSLYYLPETKVLTGRSKIPWRIQQVDKVSPYQETGGKKTPDYYEQSKLLNEANLAYIHQLDSFKPESKLMKTKN
jgi:hypothetical protein